MPGLTSTTVVVVGADVAEVAATHAANVDVVLTDPDLVSLDRAVEAMRRARVRTATYTVLDVDPLASVADAWERTFDGAAVVGELEVAVSTTLARWRAQSLDLPDYYLLRTPEEWPVTRRHWYLGVVAPAAPSRVVVASPDLLSDLGHLPTGRWWPKLDELLAGVERTVPDLAGLNPEPAESTTPAVLLQP